MLNELVTWWTSQMQGLIPQAILRHNTRQSDASVISIGESATPTLPTLRLSMRRAGKESAIGQFLLDPPGIAEAQLILRRVSRRHAIAARVPEALLLERTVILPLAAEADVGNVLRYEIERITPFATEELYWTWLVTRRDRERQRLHVKLSLVPKTSVATLTSALERLSAVPSWLEVRSAGASCVIPLGHLAESDRRRRRGLRLASAGIGGLAITAIVLPFILQSVAESRVEEQLRALEPRVQLAETLRQRIASYSSGAALVAGERGRGGDPLAVLAAVTTVLPDDTFLADLSLRQGKLEISGESKAAARLIAALAASPTIREPAFVTSVTRAENGSDAFSIRANIAR
jgi:general secretion pathway protein L